MRINVRARLITGALALLMAGAVPTGSGSLSAAGEDLHVLHWNTYHGGYGTDQLLDQDRQVTWMLSRDADVISLTEVTASAASSYKGKIERATGVIWYSHHIAAQSDGSGNQILSRYPFVSTSVYHMRTNGTYKRGVAQATLDAGGRLVNFFSTHLDHEDDAIRAAQVQELVKFMSGFAEPRIVAGDLNASPGAASLQHLRADYVDTWEEALAGLSAAAYPPDNPADPDTRTHRSRIDYVLYSEWFPDVGVTSGLVPDTRDLADPNVKKLLGTADDKGVRPSDHNPLWVSLQFRPSNDATPPSVSIVEPLDGALVGGAVDVFVSAADDHRVNAVDLKVDGVVVGTDSLAPFEFRWNSADVAVGTHTLEAVAHDASGNHGVSVPVTVHVERHAVTYGEVVLYAGDAPVLNGTWAEYSDTSAAGGVRVGQPDAGAAKIGTALASPTHYFDMTFSAEAGRAYRLWLRGKAQTNSYNNDSVHVQFSQSVDANGAATYRIGTTSSTVVVLEDCSGCGLSGWGWQDNGYGAGVLGPLVYFATTGTHTVRVQAREDGLSIDQMVLSPERYLTAAPGTLKNDTTILPKASGATTANTAPVVELTSPADGTTQTAPATFTVSASATDADGTIQQVDFYAGTTKIGTDATSPYTVEWSTSTAGTYRLTAVATDNAGATTTSTAVTVGVTAPPISLTATGVKVKGLQRVDLAWSGATSTHLDVFRDGVRITTTENDGAYTDDLKRKGSATYVYRVCEAATSICSAERTVVF